MLLARTTVRAQRVAAESYSTVAHSSVLPTAGGAAPRRSACHGPNEKKYGERKNNEADDVVDEEAEVDGDCARPISPAAREA